MIIVITGPTGVGKTKLSISLAKKYNCEIINGDAIQVYRGLDIGSAKVTREEMDGIVHHLFDIKDVWEEYSIYDYQIDCRNKIDEILNRGKNVVIVGGTGLYIKSALYDYTLSSEDTIKDSYDDISTEELYHRLKELDNDIDIDRFNRRRIIRALNYYLSFNKSISNNKTGNKLLYDALFIGLTTDRDILYQKINERVDKMFSDGLLAQRARLFKKLLAYASTTSPYSSASFCSFSVKISLAYSGCLRNLSTLLIVTVSIPMLRIISVLLFILFLFIVAIFYHFFHF